MSRDENIFRNFSALDFQQQCLLQDESYHVINDFIKKIINYVASQPVGIPILNYNAFFKVEIVT